MIRIAYLSLIVAACGSPATSPVTPGTPMAQVPAAPPQADPPPAPGLVRFRSATGKYTIDIPGACTVEEHPQARVPEGYTTRVMTCLPEGGAAVTVFYLGFDRDQSDAEHVAAGEKLVKVFTDIVPDTNIENRRDITVGTAHGQEMAWHTGDRAHVARLIWQGSTQIVVIVLSANLTPTSRETLGSARLSP